MRYASLKYAKSDNLGDEIQSLASEQYLPAVDSFIDRDVGLDTVCEPSLVIMNGWFKHGPDHWRDGAARHWPPSERIRPVFFGFHLAYPELLTDAFLEYCRQWEPIGCRDRGTMEMLRAKGVEAWFSRCLTFTFPPRERPPRNGYVYIVEGQKDLDRTIIPADLLQGAVFRNHYISHKYKAQNEYKREMARTLLGEYRNHARLVITNLLHCAIPCVAMRVPVVFITEHDPLYPTGYRLDPVRDLIPVYTREDSIDWDPRPPDIRALTNEIKEQITSLVNRAAQL